VKDEKEHFFASFCARDWRSWVKRPKPSSFILGAATGGVIGLLIAIRNRSNQTGQVLLGPGYRNCDVRVTTNETQKSFSNSQSHIE